MADETQWTTLLWADLGFVVRARARSEHSLDFALFEIGPRPMDWTGADLIGLEFRTASDDWTADLDAAEPFAFGWMKWDGCTHLDFPRDCSVHVCGKENAKHIGAALARLFDAVGPMIPKWDSSVAG